MTQAAKKKSTSKKVENNDRFFEVGDTRKIPKNQAYYRMIRIDTKEYAMIEAKDGIEKIIARNARMIISGKITLANVEARKTGEGLKP